MNKLRQPDYRQLVLYPRLAWLAVYVSFAVIAGVAFTPWR